MNVQIAASNDSSHPPPSPRASGFSMPAMASVGNANEAGIPHGLRTKYQDTLRKEHLNVYLVRHGESTNNVLAKRVETAYAEGTMSLEAAREEWFAQRSDDPDLTPMGKDQAELLAQVLAPELKQGGSRAVLVASPMARALRTAQPLARALGQGVLVHPLMYENGGCYGLSEGGEFVPGKGRTAEEIKAEFGEGYDVSMLPAEGSWNGDMGREDMEEARTRSHIAASWTMSKHALALSAGGEGEKRAAIVIVCHADFIDSYLGQLLAVNAAVGPCSLKSRAASAHDSLPLVSVFACTRGRHSCSHRVTKRCWPDDASRLAEGIRGGPRRCRAKATGDPGIDGEHQRVAHLHPDRGRWPDNLLIPQQDAPLKPARRRPRVVWHR